MTDLLSKGNLAKLRRHSPNSEALKLVPEVMARRYTVIPLSVHDGALKVAMSNTSDMFAQEALAKQTRLRIEPIAASIEEIQEAIDFNYKAYDEIEKHLSSIPLLSETSDERIGIDHVIDTPIVQALTLLLTKR